MSNELTMGFESNDSRETVFTGSIRPLLTIAEHQSDDDDDKENRRPSRDSETNRPLERDLTPMDHIDHEGSYRHEGTGEQDRQGDTTDDRRPTPPSAIELITSAPTPVEVYIPDSEEELRIVGNSYPTGESQQQ